MKTKKTTVLFLGGSLFLLFLVIVISSCVGAANISPVDALKIIISKIFNLNIDFESIKESAVTIVYNIRLPRILVAMIVGGALSVAGVTYQGMLKNPMADPYVIGVSSGAALGATIAIAFNFSFRLLGLSSTSIVAFFSAIVVIIVVYSIARVGKKVPMTTLLLSGIAIGNFLTAFTSIVMIFSQSDMKKIMFWTMGSFSGKGWEQFVSITPYVLIGIAVIFYYAKDLNIILLGEDTASNLGVNVERVKRILLISSTVITALAVSVSGIIGFIGLIVPHISRLAIGPDNRKLIPLSFMWGAVMMIGCDTIARSLIVQEIPVGIITSIIGAPFFIYMLKSKKKGVI